MVLFPSAVAGQLAVGPSLGASAEHSAANLGIEDLGYSTYVQMGGASPVVALVEATKRSDGGRFRRRVGHVTNPADCPPESAGQGNEKPVLWSTQIQIRTKPPLPKS